MSDHLLTFLEQLYSLRMKAGMNVQYHQELADFWSFWATLTGAAMVISAFAGSVLTVLAAWKPNAKLVRSTKWFSVGLACLSVMAGIALLSCDMSGKAAAYQTAFVQWRDVRGDIQRLMVMAAKSSDGDRVPDLLSESLAILQTKVSSIDENEPVTTDRDRLARCQTDQIIRTYGVATDEEVKRLKETDPARWTRLRYGFVPKTGNKDRKQSSLKSGDTTSTATRSETSGSTVR